MDKPSLTLIERISVGMEDLLMTRLVPKDSPGPIFKWFFKLPIFFYRIGLPMFGGFILLLTTTGRKSGKPRHTPLEYRREEGSGCPVIMAGWGGNTDWKRNIQADPHVQVQIGRRKYAALAEPLSDAEVAAWLAEVLRLNPRSSRIWSRWAGQPVSLDDPQSVDRAAGFFPSFRLIPANG